MLSIQVESALAAHKAWARRLEYFIHGIEIEPISPDVAADFHGCVLGLWIDSIAPKYAHLESFMQLVSVHKQFHDLAAVIVRLSDQGHRDEAEKQLAEEFQIHLDSVVGSLRVFKNEVLASQADT